MTVDYQTKFDQDNGISSIIKTLGGDNVTQIFVHDISSLRNVAATLPGFEKYYERSLVFARADDIVCVLNSLDNQCLEFFSSLGVGPRDENVVVASKSIHSNLAVNLTDLLIKDYEALLTIRNLVKHNKKIVLNPYILSTREFRLAAVLETVIGRKVDLLGGNNVDIVNYANHKHNVRAKALELGIPVPEGDVVELQTDEHGKPLDIAPIQAAINRYINKNGRVIIKGSCGFSGSSIAVVENNAESIQKVLSRIAEKNDNGIYLVEVMFDLTHSPNILMYIEPNTGSISCVGATDQILCDNLAHEGNIYPSGAKTLKDMISSAHKLSKWLQSEGYCGLVGFDFGEYFNQETGEFEHFFAEINPRINAATYPKSLMEHLNRNQRQNGGPFVDAFLSTKVKTKASSFDRLSKCYGHFFFNPKTGKGLVPYNTGCLEYGKFTLAVLGKSRNEVVEMYEDFKVLSGQV
jgi:hypothetical protein